MLIGRWSFNGPNSKSWPLVSISCHSTQSMGTLKTVEFPKKIREFENSRKFGFLENLFFFPFYKYKKGDIVTAFRDQNHYPYDYSKNGKNIKRTKNKGEESEKDSIGLDRKNRPFSFDDSFSVFKRLAWDRNGVSKLAFVLNFHSARNVSKN